MRQITSEDVAGLLTGQDTPCISLYQPTHRRHPENQQDPIRYRNLLAEMENSLRQKYPAGEVETLLEKFRALERDDDFWNHRTDGLAILSSPGTFRVFDLQRTVPELLVVAASFHLKPLLRVLQSADRYQILAVSRREAKLYEGNRYALDPVELTDVPSTITEALGEELTDQHLSVASYGAGAARAGGGGAAPSVHAHGDKKDEVDIDRDRFFRVVDRGILEHHSRPSGLPLMLAALTEHHEPFRAVSHNPFLMADGVRANPEALGIDQLRAEAWRIIEPIYQQRQAGLVDNYQVARSRHLGSDDLAQVARAATEGRVGTLLVEDDRQIPGTIDAATGRIDSDGLAESKVRWDLRERQRQAGQALPGDLSDPGVDDVLDDLAELVLRMKGEVVVVPADRMPSDTGVAATYRF
jgi:hypothetical protein